MIDPRFAAVSSTAGFRFSTAVDSSPVRLAQTRLAVARAKEGDQEAFRFLYTSYANNVYGYVRSILRDDYDAEDVTQHVFTKLMTRIDRYDERGVPFFAWLVRFARNVAIDHLRTNRLTPVATVSGSDERDSADPHRTATVRQALAALPRDQREVRCCATSSASRLARSPTAWVAPKARFMGCITVRGGRCGRAHAA